MNTLKRSFNLALGKRIQLQSVLNLPYQQRILATKPNNLYAYWPLSDISGISAIDLVGKTASVDSVLNGNFETLGTGGADVFANWAETASDGNIACETTLVHSGTNALKLTAGANVNTRVNQIFLFARPNTNYTLRFWTRGDGTNSGKYAVFYYKDFLGTSGTVKSLASTGVSITTYTEVVYSFTTASDCYQLRIDLYCPSVNGGIAYFDDVTLIATTSMNALYSTGGVTKGELGVRTENTSVKFSGVTSFIDNSGPVFNSFWNGNVGSAIAWGKVDALARWADLSTNRYFFHPKSSTNQNTYLVFGKSKEGINQVCYYRSINGSSFKKDITLSVLPTGWFCMGMIWDVVSSPNRIAGFIYYDGIFQKLFDEVPTAGNQLWNNSTYPVLDRNTLLYSGGDSSQNWIGWGADVSVWDTVLTDSEMQKLMKP